MDNETRQIGSYVYNLFRSTLVQALIVNIVAGNYWEYVTCTLYNYSQYNKIDKQLNTISIHFQQNVVGCKI